jgi:hypothetical protein
VAALSVTVSVPLKLAAEAGVKTTVMVQLPPAATEVPQLLLSGKSVGFAPVTLILEMLSVAVPGLESVNGSVAVEPTVVLEKPKLVGERTAPGAGGAVPVPLRVKVTGGGGVPPPELEYGTDTVTLL